VAQGRDLRASDAEQGQAGRRALGARCAVGALDALGDGPDLRPLVPDTACGWMVVGPDAITRLKDVASFDRWRLVGTLRRPSSASDDLLLYQRSGP
jgi:hypothetical protein